MWTGNAAVCRGKGLLGYIEILTRIQPIGWHELRAAGVAMPH